jgi:cytochrome c-type biogenesis protein
MPWWLYLTTMLEKSDITFGVAFLAGVITFFSPCFFPLWPVYISYFTGVGINALRRASVQELKLYRLRMLKQSSLFVAGFLLIFIILGALGGTLGLWFGHYRIIFQQIGGVAIVLLGLYLLEVFTLPQLYRQFKLKVPELFQRWQWLNSLLSGMTFGLAWTPCIGPILASILFLATFQGGSWHGLLLLLSFALGLGLPFLLSALLLQYILPWLPVLQRYMHRVQQFLGLVLSVIGLLLVTNQFDTILQYLNSIVYHSCYDAVRYNYYWFGSGWANRRYLCFTG